MNQKKKMWWKNLNERREKKSVQRQGVVSKGKKNCKRQQYATKNLLRMHMIQSWIEGNGN